VPAATGSCAFACTVDADCTSRPEPGAHAADRCRANVCVHTHDPEATAPGALAAVADAFAVHGIALHVLRGNARPHSQVVSFRRKQDMAMECEGGDQASGTEGLGKYAASIYDLKEIDGVDTAHLAYHYALFAHYSSCDTQEHCSHCAAAANPDGTLKNAPVAGESGIAEIAGNDFIVSLGSRSVDVALAYSIINVGGTFMHELGHNLGLYHGGGTISPCTSDADCRGGIKCDESSAGKFCFGEDLTNWKPNHLSVMNYRYQFTGITPAKVAGGTEPFTCAADGDCPAHLHCNTGVCVRLDYSSEVLPTGGNTPGALEERNANGFPGLNEPAGLGGATSDLFTYTDAMCDIPWTVAPTMGPVDWNGDGDTTDTSVSADLSSGVDHACGEGTLRLVGMSDWAAPLTYKFQCTSFGGPNGDGSAGARALAREITTREAMAAHALYPVRSARAILRAGRSRTGSVSVILLGAPGFAAADVDPQSLVFHGARPTTVSVRDANHDGRPDLVAVFDGARVKLHPRARQARLRGWLRSSQLFAAEIPLR